MFIESILYQLSSWFLIPVLLTIIFAFVYTLYQLGQFLIEGLFRLRKGTEGCALWQYRQQHPTLDSEHMELFILKELEGLRITARTAPLLGLVATMIPMGPALAGVAAGEMALVGEQVGIAFAAVIVALIAASGCFIMLTIKRRWRVTTLKHIEDIQSASCTNNRHNSIKEAA
ncbi:MotA/TolQ/ExbB proton channel family protein [Methylophaga nitratireducenticrescens]|uniref:Transporter PduT for various metalloporphyrins n=1 Tax=Methylophaga nitratireducenticrescens TaxID=754476 RepID=I1XH24_METNJ|nr:MotA/TolQ/ExbB proton channel family protein [Methylophaga nitratireducenticrescens]AFI83693.1 biopolymer transporter ExbD [Methylophaga nitratireducenticrescens]AUZ83820.1 biopolymer transporter ExbD [Methylophaga nitratireducenticrescens]